MAKSNDSTARRKARIRRAIARQCGRPSASRVFRSSAQIYAQIIDDEKGVTLAAASTLEKALREELKTGANIEAARRVGKVIAERAKKAGVESRVRPRRLHVPRPRQGAGRGRPRRRPRLLKGSL